MPRNGKMQNKMNKPKKNEPQAGPPKPKPWGKREKEFSEMTHEEKCRSTYPAGKKLDECINPLPRKRPKPRK